MYPTNSQPALNPEAAPTVPSAVPPEPGGLVLFAASFVMPFASLSFYRRAVRAGLGRAILFFVVFMGLVTVITTVGLARSLFVLTNDIRAAFEQGRVPEITISGGVASVRAPQPVIIFNQDGVLVAVDTTGQLTSIDPRAYRSGFLLTRNNLVMLNQGEVQAIPLDQVNQVFQQDPVIINGETTAHMWQNFSAIFSGAALIGLALWDILVRLLYLAALGVVMFGLASLFRKTPYGAALTIGVYAFVPGLISAYILGRFGIHFIFLQTIILIVFWTIGLYAALVPNGWDLLGPDRPLRAWRAWLGLPLLMVLALDVIYSWPNGALINLIAAAVTGIAMVAAGMVSLPQRDEEEILPPPVNP